MFLTTFKNKNADVGYNWKILVIFATSLRGDGCCSQQQPVTAIK